MAKFEIVNPNTNAIFYVTEGSNIYKAQKLIRVFLEHENKTIQSIRISGDFFIHPEESLEKLESDLAGTKLEKKSLVDAITKSLENAEVFGFDYDSMADAVLGCLNK